MEESIYILEEIIALEKSNKEDIYLYAEEDTQSPLWIAFGASANRLHELIPELNITYEDNSAIGHKIAVIRNIASSVILSRYQMNIHCKVYFM